MEDAPFTIPGVNECLDLMEQYHMLPNIKDHSIVVTEVAGVITNGLIAAGYDLSLETVIAGALLHDIGKTACLDNDDDHAARGLEICLAHNLKTIADIVAEHVILKNYAPQNGFAEKEIVYYADKRVNHDKVVSLEERLDYILERYGMNNEVRCRAIKRNYARCQDLEKRMFSFLSFDPADISELLIAQQSILDQNKKTQQSAQGR
ncbi:MAG: HDIG domain-containing protein [Desulfobulbaceae bacterium]|jgi:putative nucleotidyltransferase with HDIG domain|nr:HDIG domain-containing protein [Desulfobulbaceae bacterium]MDH3542668.1 HDIG domain-containing protein [Desulfobulbaceae bacterium]MDH3866452.1 HDIG domain-containing protein [Desulfobulbaceae bacterium]HKJ14519.1 HDIG domain-containing protein [Desulfobulbales bacterium]